MKRLTLYALSAAVLFGAFVLFGLAVVRNVGEDVCDHVAAVEVPYELGERPLCVIYKQVDP